MALPCGMVQRRTARVRRRLPPLRARRRQAWRVRSDPRACRSIRSPHCALQWAAATARPCAPCLSPPCPHRAPEAGTQWPRGPHMRQCEAACRSSARHEDGGISVSLQRRSSACDAPPYLSPPCLLHAPIGALPQPRGRGLPQSATVFRHPTPHNTARATARQTDRRCMRCRWATHRCFRICVRSPLKQQGHHGRVTLSCGAVQRRPAILRVRRAARQQCSSELCAVIHAPRGETPLGGSAPRILS